MWGRVVQFVGFMLLVAIVASVVSPWFDLHPTLRTSKRGVTHYGLAVSLFQTPAPSDSQIVLISTRAVQLRQGCDIVARDCARLC